MRKHAPPKATLPNLLYECQEKFGKIFRLYTFTTPLVVTAEAQIARYILGKPKLFGVSKMFGRAFGALVPNGMLIIEGDQWKRTQHTHTSTPGSYRSLTLTTMLSSGHRSALKHAFEPAQLKLVVAATNIKCDEMFSEWRKEHEQQQKSQGRSGNSGISVDSHFSSLTMDVIGLVAFDRNFNSVKEPDNVMKDDIRTLQDGTVSRIPLPRWMWRMLPHQKAFAEAEDRARGMLGTVLGDHRGNSLQSVDSPRPSTSTDAAGAGAGAGGSDSSSSTLRTADGRRRDILTLLFSAQKRARQEGSDVLTDAEIIDELIMFFLAVRVLA